MSHSHWLPAAVHLLRRLAVCSDSDQRTDAGPARRRHNALLQPGPPSRACTDAVPGDEWTRRARRGAARVGMAVESMAVLSTGFHPTPVITGT